MADDLLLQQIESTVNVVAGKEGYSISTLSHTERLESPPLSPTRLLTG